MELHLFGLVITFSNALFIRVLFLAHTPHSTVMQPDLFFLVRYGELGNLPNIGHECCGQTISVIRTCDLETYKWTSKVSDYKAMTVWFWKPLNWSLFLLFCETAPPLLQRAVTFTPEFKSTVCSAFVLSFTGLWSANASYSSLTAIPMSSIRSVPCGKSSLGMGEWMRWFLYCLVHACSVVDSKTDISMLQWESKVPYCWTVQLILRCSSNEVISCSTVRKVH